MALVCNIDQRGRAVRYRIGFVLLGLGVAGALLARAAGLVELSWLIGIPLVLGGAFALFEANRGWCAVRALGFKTKI